jgi:predicted GNAT superfamily acetyltransferase
MERLEAAPVSPVPVEIRHCRTIAEYEECVRLERITWGQGILVPTAIFAVAQETGGQILGAYAGNQMVGFTLALAGVHDGRPFLHSHMTAVLEAFRDHGVGRRLKLFQRQDALARGFPLVEWTFDPLELKNAHFNFMRLGAIARRFIPNFYGITESPLHAGMPTDRLVAEWWLDSPRVNSLLAASTESRGHETQSQAQPQPHLVQLAQAAKISVPMNISELRLRDRAAAQRIQSEVREQFESLFAKGYAATGIATSGASAEYDLQPVASVAAEIFPANQR